MRYLILIAMIICLSTCGSREPDNPPNSRFFGKSFRLSLIAAKRYQRPEKHGYQVIKSMNGDTYAMEKAALLNNSHLTKVNGLTYDSNQDFFGLKAYLTPEGINIFNHVLQNNRKRKLAFIVDDIAVATFEADKAIEKKIIHNERLNIRANFSRNEIEAVLKGFLSVRNEN